MDHRERVPFSQRAKAAFEFEEFVGKVVLEALGVTGEVRSDVADGGFDFQISSEGQEILVEVKLDTPSTSNRARQIGSRMREIGQLIPGSRMVLAVPGVVAPDRLAVLQKDNVQVLDGRILTRTARRLGVQLPESVDFADDHADLVGKKLIQRLDALPAGKKQSATGWVAYQKLCEEILAYLFCPGLENPRTEVSTASKVNRRDIVMANYATDGFWEFMRSHYRADFVIADAKNYAAAIKKSEVLQIANYLTDRGAGLFGLIITRVGASVGARWTMREQWVLYNKLIVVLDDSDVRQMLIARDSGTAAELVIRQKIEDFRLDL
ncbi:hypothetical protein Actkin_03179 [Actinokineospora sp. UTMC 2448]|nr:hypothetical protein Actkin_03179 [Actinokineospora sp. UTMC 2448]